MAFPVPVIDISVEPRTKEAVEKMSLGLQKLAGRGSRRCGCAPTRRPARPSCRGMGELHLEIIIDRLRREYGVEANIGAPQVAYRETITRAHTETYTHKKQTGGSGQYAEVKITFEPLERNERRRVREQGGRRLGAEGVHPGGGEGHQGAGRDRRAGRLPDGGLQVHAAGRQVPRRRLVGAGVRDRRQGLLPRRHEEGRRRSSWSR